MITNPAASEICGMCGNALESARVFCRFYERKNGVAFCSPSCAREHLLASRVNGGRRLADDFVGQFLAEWTWRELGR